MYFLLLISSTLFFVFTVSSTISSNYNKKQIKTSLWEHYKDAVFIRNSKSTILQYTFVNYYTLKNIDSITVYYYDNKYHINLYIQDTKGIRYFITFKVKNYEELMENHEQLIKTIDNRFLTVQSLDVIKDGNLFKELYF